MFNWLQNKLQEREKEYKLQEEQERWRALQQNARDCISMMKNGRTLGECEAYLEGRGYSKDDAINASGLAFCVAIGLSDIHGNMVGNWNLGIVNHDKLKKALGSEEKYNFFCQIVSNL